MEQSHNWVYHTPSQTTWTPPQTRGIKRTISESDCEDAYSETSSKDQYVSNKNTSPGDSDSCQLLSRKKRRGVIEKKRRDKINSSLSELKRLVPAAYEKQGSAKLEKAEILQLTVDHLKALHAKGEGFPYDHQRYVLDYHLSGFRECISEIARYLAAIEGMDLQDPLRLRIMSHLQCFLTQKELAARANSTGFQTYPAAPPPFPIYHQQNYSHPHHQGQTFMHQVPTHTSEHPVTQADSTTASPHAPPTYTTRASSTASVAATASLQLHSTQQHMANANYSVSESTHVDQHQGATYLDLTHSNSRALQTYPMVPFSSGSDVYSTNANFNNNSSKPYRPWGAEMAY